MSIEKPKYKQSARDFAKETHNGQMYGDKDYYEHHFLGVSKIAISMIPDTHDNIAFRDYVSSLAVLHDTIEDYDISRDAIHCHFGDRILVDLTHLSKNPNMSYDEYITNLVERGSIEALIVKLADLSFNINSGLEELKSKHNLFGRKFAETRLAKYRLAYLYIIEAGSKRYPSLNNFKEIKS